MKLQRTCREGISRIISLRIPATSVGFGAENLPYVELPPLIKRKIMNYTWVPKSIAVIAEIKGVLLKTGTNYWV